MRLFWAGTWIGWSCSLYRKAARRDNYNINDEIEMVPGNGAEISFNPKEVGTFEEFEKCGYKVKYRIMNSAEYGVPQKRERVIIVGIRNDLDVEFEYPNTIINDFSEFVPLSCVLEESVPEKYYFSERAVAGMMRNRKAMNKGRAQDITKPCNTVGAHLTKAIHFRQTFLS